MSGVAIGGAAIIGAGASIYSSNKASKQASASRDAAARSSASANASIQDQLQFDKQQYADWQSIYGNVQDNLSSYYNSLTPDHYRTLNIQATQEAFQQGVQNLDQNLAQRGLNTSGIEAQGLIQLESKRDTTIAGVNASADQAVADQKSQFLGIGLGQQSTLQNNIANAYGNQASQFANQANVNNNLASDSQAQANAGYANAGKAIAGGVSTYMKYK